MADKEWTFTVKPWADGSTHDVDAHKRRAKAYMVGPWLSRPSDISDVAGPEVIEHPDGSASVTYRLIT